MATPARPTPYMRPKAPGDETFLPSPVGKQTSSLVQPFPRLKNDGTANVVVKPSVNWIVYGKYNDKKKKKLHNTRAAELRLKLRQIVRAWHTFVETTRLCRQANITSVMVRTCPLTG